MDTPGIRARANRDNNCYLQTVVAVQRHLGIRLSQHLSEVWQSVQSLNFAHEPSVVLHLCKGH